MIEYISKEADTLQSIVDLFLAFIQNRETPTPIMIIFIETSINPADQEALVKAAQDLGISMSFGRALVVLTSKRD